MLTGSEYTASLADGRLTHVRQALRYADRAYVLRRGRIALSGTATELAGRISEIEDSYLTRATR
jgi:ABC-type branched-subunit amino acid transport system ATPase component